MTYDPALVREVMAENRPKLLGAVSEVQAAIAQYLARNIAKGSSK